MKNSLIKKPIFDSMKRITEEIPEENQEGVAKSDIPGIQQHPQHKSTFSNEKQVEGGLSIPGMGRLQTIELTRSKTKLEEMANTITEANGPHSFF